MRAAPAALVLSLALTACGGDEPAAGPRGGPSVTASPTGATASASASPTGSEPGSAAPQTSASPSRPAGPARDGDVDGDGRADRITATQDLLTVVLTSGRTITAPVEADAEPPVQGVVDVDRDGRAEVFLETTRGASTVFYTPYRYDGRDLRPLRIEGEVARLGVGGSITHGDGFACAADGRLVLSSSSSTDGESFDVVTTLLRIDGDALVTLSRRTATGLRQGDERVAASYRVDCGSVVQDG